MSTLIKKKNGWPPLRLSMITRHWCHQTDCRWLLPQSPLHVLMLSLSVDCYAFGFHLSQKVKMAAYFLTIIITTIPTYISFLTKFSETWRNGKVKYYNERKKKRKNVYIYIMYINKYKTVLNPFHALCQARQKLAVVIEIRSPWI